MSTHKDKYEAAKAALKDGLVTALTKLAQLDQDLADEKILPGYHAKQREAIRIEARVADGKAGDLLRAYEAETLAAARALRAKAEAERDPTARVADELERRRLLESQLDGDEYAAQAQAMLDAGQAQRAAFLLSVARDKGARVTGELATRIEAALDQSVPDRKAALELEQAVARDVAAYGIARAQALSGTLGMGDGGDVGNGSVSDRASASVRAKVGQALAASAGVSGGDA